MSSFLCTTADSRFWNFEADRLVFLGHWCLRYDERGLLAGRDTEVLPHPWDDRGAMRRAAVYEQSLYRKILLRLAAFFNQVHGQQRDVDYWQTLSGHWLLHFIQVLHERYRCLAAAAGRYPGISTRAASEGPLQPALGSQQFTAASIDDFSNLLLYAFICRNSEVDIDVQAVAHPLGPPQCDAHFGFRRKTKWFLRTVSERLSPLWAGRAPVLLSGLYMPPRSVLTIMGKTRLRARWGGFPDLAEVLGRGELPRHEQRSALARINHDSGDPFEKLLVCALPDHLPLAYLEGYDALRAWVERRWGRSRPRLIVTANGLAGAETFKTYAAERRAAGAKIIALQHGGSYGTARFNPNETLESKIADEFWSWGWKSGSGRRIRPMPSPYLSSLRSLRKRTKGGERIVYIANNIPRYHYRNWSVPTANQGLAYIEGIISFFSSIDDPVRKAISLRLYPDDYGWCQYQRLKDACPRIRFADGRKGYAAELARTALAVCDMNQTTLLECLAADIPVVAFWNPEMWELRPEAQPYFEDLKKARILHDAPSSAAAWINRCWPQVRSWWKDRDVVRCRDRFRSRFASTSATWPETWAAGMGLG